VVGKLRLCNLATSSQSLTSTGSICSANPRRE
jgi:hypothetical protein